MKVRDPEEDPGILFQRQLVRDLQGRGYDGAPYRTPKQPCECELGAECMAHRTFRGYERNGYPAHLEGETRRRSTSTDLFTIENRPGEFIKIDRYEMFRRAAVLLAVLEERGMLAGQTPIPSRLTTNPQGLP